MAHVKLTLFSLDEANELARDLKPEIERLVAAHAELTRIETAWRWRAPIPAIPTRSSWRG
jgi:hypothetical protein